jgi:hypothetical protein
MALLPNFPSFKISPLRNLRRTVTKPGHPYSRYWFSAVVVISTLVLIGLGEIVFGSVPLMLFAGAIVAASKISGIGGGIFSAILSTLACDFFFLPPIFALDFDQNTWTLAAKYGAVALLSYVIFRQKQLETVPMERPAVASCAHGAGYGHLDGVREGELFGWAIDPYDPAEPAKVTAHVNNRPVAEALAVYYRPDVAEQFRCSGRHGFFLDLSQLCDGDKDAAVDVRLSNGKLVEGAPLRAHVPCRRRPPGPTLLFMHIPKTAGTTLRKSMIKNYRRSEIAYLYPEPPGFPVRNLRDLPLTQRAQFRLVAGHFQYGIHNEIPNDYWYFTIVRNPVARVWSHYQYLIEVKDPAIIRDGEIKSLQEALENRMTANLDNLMVRCFAGVNEEKSRAGSINRDVYERAKQHLQDAFVYVGQQEALPAAYAVLKDKLGWQWSIPPETVNRGSYISGEQMDEAKAELIRQFNAWDMKLYEQAIKLFP